MKIFDKEEKEQVYSLASEVSHSYLLITLIFLNFLY